MAEYKQTKEDESYKHFWENRCKLSKEHRQMEGGNSLRSEPYHLRLFHRF